MDTLELRGQLERYHREGYGWALACCSHNRADAEDVLQTVYLKVLEGRAQYDGKATFKTWFFSVIRNTAADERRRHMLHRLRLAASQRNARHEEQDDPLDDAISRLHTQTMFRQALAALPRRQREVLHLVFYHDLNLQEASEVMRISIGSARVHYERGKKRLRQWLGASEGLDEARLERPGTQRIVPRTAPGG